MSNIVSELILKTGLFSSGVKSAQNVSRACNPRSCRHKGIIQARSRSDLDQRRGDGTSPRVRCRRGTLQPFKRDRHGGRPALILQRAFTMSGIEADKVGPAVGRMRKQIVGGCHGRRRGGHVRPLAPEFESNSAI